LAPAIGGSHTFGPMPGLAVLGHIPKPEPVDDPISRRDPMAWRGHPPPLSCVAGPAFSTIRDRVKQRLTRPQRARFSRGAVGCLDKIPSTRYLVPARSRLPGRSPGRGGAWRPLDGAPNQTNPRGRPESTSSRFKPARKRARQSSIAPRYGKKSYVQPAPPLRTRPDRRP
jgi:hypothetical protein